MAAIAAAGWGVQAAPARTPVQRPAARAAGAARATGTAAPGRVRVAQRAVPASGLTAVDGGLRLDGRPFVPVVSWAQCPEAVPQSLALGVNVFLESCAGRVNLDRLATAAAAGGALVLGAATEPPFTGPGASGDVQRDEPDAWGVQPVDLPEPRRAPGRLTFLTLTAGFSALQPPPAGVPRSAYPAYAAKADVLGTDVYPLAHGCGRSSGLRPVYDVQRDLVALADGRPTFQWIEVNPLEHLCDGQAPPPDATTVAAETWLAFAGGATGIGWFTWGWPGGAATTFSVDAPVQAALAGLARQIGELAPFLATRAVEPAAAGATGPVAPEPLRVGLRRAGGALLAIAVNPLQAAAGQLQLRLPGVAAGTAVTVVGEGRTLVAGQGGAVTDMFAGFGAHLYLVAPSGRSSRRSQGPSRGSVDPLRRLQPVEAGHREVEEADVRLLAPGQLARSAAEPTPVAARRRPRRPGCGSRGRRGRQSMGGGGFEPP